MSKVALDMLDRRKTTCCTGEYSFLNCRPSPETLTEMIKDSPARNESECLGTGATLTQDEMDTQKGNGYVYCGHWSGLRVRNHHSGSVAQDKSVQLSTMGFHKSTSSLHSAFEEGTCGRHWDDYLCWPVSGVGSTVRIPCRASLPFVQAVMEAMPDIERDEIKGEEHGRRKSRHGQGGAGGAGPGTCYWCIDP